MRFAQPIVAALGCVLATTPSLAAMQDSKGNPGAPAAPSGLAPPPAAPTTGPPPSPTRQELTVAPSWYPERPGEVVAIPARPGAATVEDVVPVPTPFGKPVKNLIAAWNGGTLIEMQGEPFLALHGGGHGDYGGNEIVVFGPLTAELPAWSLLSPPTPQALIDLNAPYNLDGTPNVSHSRDTLCFLDGTLYRALQAGIFTATTSWETFDSFDLLTAIWAPEATHPDVPAGGGVRGSAVADSNAHVVWVLRDGSGSRLKMFSPATNSWRVFQSTYTTAIETTAAFSASRNEIFLFDNSSIPRHALFDLDDPDANPVTQGFSGMPPPHKCGLAWDAGRQVYVALGMDDRSVVVEMDPITQRWSPRSFQGPTEPIPQDAWGIWGRFQYVEDLCGYVYVGATDGAVYFYRSQ